MEWPHLWAGAEQSGGCEVSNIGQHHVAWADEGEAHSGMLLAG